jgi:hypothetical protein
LWSILRIDACGTEEQQLLNSMSIGFTDDIALYLHVHHNEVGTIKRVCHDTTYKGCCENYCIGALFIEELLHGYLIGKVELFMTATNKIGISALKKVVPNGTAYKTVMASYINLAIFA